MFSDKDSEGVMSPHDDALVIIANIFGFDVERILVDIRSSAEVMYLKVFEKMGLDKRRLKSLKQ